MTRDEWISGIYTGQQEPTNDTNEDRQDATGLDRKTEGTSGTNAST